MRNSEGGFGWFGLLARLALMLGLFVALGAIAEDDKNPTPPPQQAPAPPANPPATPPPATKKADPSAADANPVEPDDDYDKNATKRFTPSERTPADRNVSFPVDI